MWQFRRGPVIEVADGIAVVIGGIGLNDGDQIVSRECWIWTDGNLWGAGNGIDHQLHFPSARHVVRSVADQ